MLLGLSLLLVVSNPAEEFSKRKALLSVKGFKDLHNIQFTVGVSARGDRNSINLSLAFLKRSYINVSMRIYRAL